MSDSVPVYVFKIGNDMTNNQIRQLTDALGEATERANLDGEFVLFNGEIEAIDKDELIEELQ